MDESISSLSSALVETIFCQYSPGMFYPLACFAKCYYLFSCLILSRKVLQCYNLDRKWKKSGTQISVMKKMMDFQFGVYQVTFEPWQEISNNLVCATSNGSDQPTHTHSLIRAFASRLNIL